VSIKQRVEELPEGIESNDVKELREALWNTQKQLLKSKDRTKLLVDAVFQAAHEAMLAMGPIKPVIAPPKDARKGKPEVALAHTTDWQLSKVTTSYNSVVGRKRVMQFAEKVVALTEIQRTHHPVRECHILFGGDIIEGIFNFPSQVFEVDATIFDQWDQAARLAVDFVRYILANFEKVTVTAEWGNHGRIGSKRDNVPRSDNFDRMVYQFARRLLADEKRLTWEDCPEDIQYGEIGTYKYLLIHGDEVGRGGVSSAQSLVRFADRWKSGAYHRPFDDVYVGHMHTHAEWPMAATGSVYQTGSTESDNRYARDFMAASSAPSQRLHFIDPIKGRVTNTYKVWLD
jgi:hypothetical protein